MSLDRRQFVVLSALGFAGTLGDRLDGRPRRPDLAVQGRDRLDDTPPRVGLLLGSAFLLVFASCHLNELTCSLNS